MLTDMWFTVAMMFPVVLVFIIIEAVVGSKPSPLDNHLNGRWFFHLTPFLICVFTLLNKDYFGSQSVAKRIYGYQILNVKTKLAASPVRCIIRNVTAPIWPVELVFVLINPKRRLGDLIAGTELTDRQPTNPESILDDIADPLSYKEPIMTICLSLLFTAMLVLVSILPSLKS